MRSWLVGFVVFGIAYAIFVIAIFAVNWPTLQNPRLYTTLESKLSDSVAGSVVKVVRHADFPEIDSNFVIEEQAYELEDGSLTSTIAIINGHLIVLRMNNEGYIIFLLWFTSACECSMQEDIPEGETGGKS